MTSASTISSAASSLENRKQTSYAASFAIMTLLFFMWDFMTVWNDILIPRPYI